MSYDAHDRLNIYKRPFHDKLQNRPFSFLFPKIGLILLVSLATLTIAVQLAYGCEGNNGGGGGGSGANGNKNNKNNKGVQGHVQLAVQAPQQNSVRVSFESSANPTANLTIKLNLQDVPSGKHRADIHQGTCPLNFTLDGQPSQFGPFTPGVTLPLGNVQPKADGTLKKTLKFQVGGTTGIPVNFLQGGNWFFCIHTGTLAQVTGTTPAQQFASLKKFLATSQGPGQVQQLVCQPLNAPQGKNSLTLNFQSGQGTPTPGS
jgi:hypothetical protein